MTGDARMLRVRVDRVVVAGMKWVQLIVRVTLNYYQVYDACRDGDDDPIRILLRVGMISFLRWSVDYWVVFVHRL